MLSTEETELFRICLQTEEMRKRGVPPQMFKLPASDQATREMKNSLHVEDFAEAAVTNVICMDDALSELLPVDFTDVDLLDQFADQFVTAASNGERGKSLAVLEIEKPATLDAAASLLGRLDDYTLMPDDTEAYGKESLRRIGADEELLTEIDGFMDYAAYGCYMMEAYGVRITDYGILRRDDNPLPDPDRGIRMEDP